MEITGGAVTYNILQVPIFITNNLVHCTSSNSATQGLVNQRYMATITAEQGYTLEGASVSIIMNGINVTNEVYSNGIINISKISGDVSISISAVLDGAIPTSAKYFTFSGNAITGYTGTDTKVVLPKSYSVSASTIIPAPGTKAYIQPYSSWGTSINSTRWNYLTYISFTDGTKTVKYERTQYTVTQFKSQIQIDFPDYSKVYLDSIKTTTSSSSYNVRQFFSQASTYNMFKYPLSLTWGGVTHTWQDYSTTVETGTDYTLSTWFQNVYRYDSDVGQKDLVGAGGSLITYTYSDGDDYQVTSVGARAFQNQTSVEKIIIPE